jgi:subtilisin family serine protease
MVKRSLQATLAFLLAVGSTGWSGALPDKAELPPHHPDRVLVQPTPGVEQREFAQFLREQGFEIETAFGALAGLSVVRVPPSWTVPGIITQLASSKLVAYAEPDYLVHACATPDDPRFLDGSLWGLHNTGQSSGLADADIDAVEGWDLQTSASHVIVAVLDTGIRQSHEDLKENLWTNPVDGTHGFNAFTGNHDPEDDNGHGTMVAGVLGAVGNNAKGVTGVAWQVQILAAKCLDASGSGSDSRVIACLEFARTNGARIINASFDSTGYSQSLSNAIARVRDDGILLVASSGNNHLDLDLTPRYPACYGLENIVVVAYTTRTDQLGTTSNFGISSVDLAAPGGAAYLAFFAADNSYLPGGFVTGSSFAAPHVAGAAALVMERLPSARWNEVRERLLGTVDPLPSLVGRCGTSGRLNLHRLLRPYARLWVDRPAVEDATYRLGGDPGTTWVIEMSEDLKGWEGLSTYTLPSTGMSTFRPPSGAERTRFVRARQAP